MYREREIERCIDVCIYIYIYIYTHYVYMCVYIYIYIYIAHPGDASVQKMPFGQTPISR